MWFGVMTATRSGCDAHAHWTANPSNPYRVSAVGAPDAYIYSPVLSDVPPGDGAATLFTRLVRPIIRTGSRETVRPPRMRWSAPERCPLRSRGGHRERVFCSSLARRAGRSGKKSPPI